MPLAFLLPEKSGAGTLCPQKIEENVEEAERAAYDGQNPETRILKNAASERVDQQSAEVERCM